MKAHPGSCQDSIHNDHGLHLTLGFKPNNNQMLFLYQNTDPICVIRNPYYPLRDPINAGMVSNIARPHLFRTHLFEMKDSILIDDPFSSSSSTPRFFDVHHLMFR